MILVILTLWLYIRSSFLLDGPTQVNRFGSGEECFGYRRSRIIRVVHRGGPGEFRLMILRKVSAWQGIREAKRMIGRDVPAPGGLLDNPLGKAA